MAIRKWQNRVTSDDLTFLESSNRKTKAIIVASIKEDEEIYVI